MDTNSNICDFILFGGHGDLAFRKLLPALYHLREDNSLCENTRIITISRRDISIQDHIELVKDKLNEYIENFDEEFFDNFKKQLYLVVIDLNKNETYENLKHLLDEYPNRDRVNYLSLALTFLAQICESLDYWKLINNQSRVVLEKPLGRDLKTSKKLNKKVLKYFKEDQVFRIDHYLGKDTVQNILALRFSNILFLPLWNANHIDHIQITVAESVGVENRWDYYNEYGALRDMIQTILCSYCV